MKKQIIGTLIAFTLLMLWVGLNWPFGRDRDRLSGQPPPANNDLSENEKAPFSFNRQQVAKLAESADSSWKPRRPKRTIPSRKYDEDAFAKLMDKARAATDAGEVYRLLMKRMQEQSSSKALEAIRRLMDQGSGSWPERFLNMDVTEREELLRLLETPEIAQLLALAEEAVTKDQCDFKLDYSEGFALVLPHLSPLRDIARLTSLVGMVRILDGDVEDALLATGIGLRTGSDIGTDPLIISQLVALGVDRTVLDSLAGLAAEPNLPSAQAYSILVELARRDYVADMAAAIRHENDMLVSEIEKWQGKYAQQEQVPELAEFPDAERILRDPALVDRNAAIIRDLSERYIQCNTLPSIEAREALTALDREIEVSLDDPDLALARSVVPLYGRSLIKAQESLAEFDAVYVNVLCTVYRSQHGRDPQSFEDLQIIIRAAEEVDSGQ